MVLKLAKHKLDLLNDLVYKSKKPQQALKELEKWMKRDPNNIHLQLLRAKILFECGRHEESLIVCNKLAKQEPRTVEVSIIRDIQVLICRHQIHNSTVKFTAGPEVVDLWQNALKLQKEGKDLLFEWYGVAARCGHWEDVRMILSDLRKAFPNESKYFFHYIAATQIAADILLEDDPIRSKLNSTLAFKFLETAVKQSLTQPGSRNSLVTARDLSLLVYIYQKQGHRKELLSVLDSDQIGIHSKIGMSDGQFVKAKLNILEEEQLWPELRTFCQSLLRGLESSSEHNPRNDFVACDTSGADWSVFAALLRAVDHSDIESVSASEDLIRNYMKTDTSDFSSRNASLALVALHDQHRRAFCEGHKLSNQNTGILSSVVDACVEYYSKFGQHNCCYGDLRGFVENFTAEEQAMFMRSIHTVAKEFVGDTESERTKLKWINSEANSLKFDYLFHISLPRNETPTEETLCAFLENCLKLLKLAKSSRQDGVREVYILAVMALVRLRFLLGDTDEDRSQGHLLQAACLLSLYLKYSPDDRQTSLLLARIYTFMGLGSLVMRQYSALGIKEIMHDTLSHALYSRISTTHPFAAPNSTSGSVEGISVDPYAGIEFALSHYKSFVDDINNCLSNLQELSFHDKMSEFRDLKKNFDGSFTKQMLVLERRRIARLTGCQDNGQDLKDVDIWLTGIRDNRDYETVPNYERSSARTFEECLWNGPKPGVYWIATLILIDDTCSLLTKTASFRDHDLETAQHFVANATENQQDELTEAEKALNKGWATLRPLVRRVMLGPEAEGKLSISESFQKLKAFLDDTHASSSNATGITTCALPEWKDIQPMFLHLEFLKACSKLSDVVLSCLKQKSHELQGKISKDDISFVSNSVQEIREGIDSRAKNWKTRLAEGGLSSLMDQALRGPMGGIVEEHVGTENMEACISACRDSAEDALDGVLRVKIA